MTAPLSELMASNRCNLPLPDMRPLPPFGERVPWQLNWLPNNSMEPTRPAGGYEVCDTSLGWPGGSSRGR